MPFNGSGTFQRLRNWVADAAGGIKIRADYHDSEDDNFRDGLSQTITRDGQSTVVANIPFGGFRVTNVADPVNDQDAVTKKWAETSIVAGAHIADAIPAAAKVGNLWWESDTGNLFVKYDDGSSVQWVQVNVASPPAYQTGAFKRTVITVSTGGFQFDDDTTYADIECFGAGGAGGGIAGSGTGVGTAGGGGAGGGYAKKLIEVTDAVRAATKTITIGAGGAAATGGSGGAGGDTSYTDTVNTFAAGGGGGGTVGAITTTAIYRSGGLGTSGSGVADIKTTGIRGGNGHAHGSTSFTTAGYGTAIGGDGAPGPLANQGGTGVQQAASTGQGSGTGGNGSLMCGGGGAAGINAYPSSLPGGAGGNGLAIITEYR